MTKKIKVIELFAGVGGFRLGLEGWKGKSALSSYRKNKESLYDFVWSNQREPNCKKQYANLVYSRRFKKGIHNTELIDDVLEKENINKIDFDLLVAGFPCQDYSVGTLLKNSKGLIGKKGVLWWSIYKLLQSKKNKPNYLLFENVDRLLKSPADKKGRDFAVILKSLDELGYAVEWRVVNAGNYGMPQKRKRIFFIGYHKKSNFFKSLSKFGNEQWLVDNGTMFKAFPSSVMPKSINDFFLPEDLITTSSTFGSDTKSLFRNAGFMIDGKIVTFNVKDLYNGNLSTMKEILFKGKIPDEFFVDDEVQLDKWRKCKKSKNIPRKLKNGFTYNWSEGNMPFPDDINKPARTIITSEGGNSPSRTKHIIFVNNRYRRLIPVELERVNMFPSHFTRISDKIPDSRRAFLMGNALVVGVVEKIGNELYKNYLKYEN